MFDGRCKGVPRAFRRCLKRCCLFTRVFLMGVSEGFLGSKAFKRVFYGFLLGLLFVVYDGFKFKGF